MRERLLSALAAALLLPGTVAAGQAPPSAGPPRDPEPAQAAAAAPEPAPAFTWSVRDWTRADRWSYFQPAPPGGDPDYGYVANRLQIGLRRQRPKYELNGALQYVQFGGLPTGASGPGQLGAGATYYETNHQTGPGQLYVRYLNVLFKNVAPHLDVQVGRMGYASGAETASGDAKIEAVKRQRVDTRMVGEFEWSLFQRGFDGARVDYRRPDWAFTVAAFHPTQGGFERRGSADIDAITVLAGNVGLRPSHPLAHTDLELFAYRYDDTRDVQARPDNEGRTASRADVKINSLGTTIAGAYPLARDQVDVLLWVVGQTGTWFDRSHRAYAFAAEAGYQWARVPWRPWVRAGIDRASGDADPRDGTHGTFFPMLPTARRYSMSLTYTAMNLDDRFVQALLRPAARLNLRVDLHQLSLADAADRWYTGSGATQASGTIFGYAGRASQGGTGLGTVAEGSADLQIARHWNVNGYVAFMRGGDVVRRTFAGDRLAYAYVENVLSF